MVLLDAAAAVFPARRLIVATFDHGTCTAATQAAALVERRAKNLGIECVTERAEVALSSEAQLREARWRFLRSVAAHTAGAVCTAHSADDQIETVLMRVLRDINSIAEESATNPDRAIGQLIEFYVQFNGPTEDDLLVVIVIEPGDTVN